MTTIRIDAPTQDDKASWAALFLGYRRFYEVPDDPHVIERVWEWIHDPDHQTECLLARNENGRPIGLAHFRNLARPLSGTQAGFLDDLFVEPDSRDRENALAEREQAQFDAAAEALRQAIEAVPELAQIQDTLIVEQTPAGLRIQLVDQAGYSMFALGSAQPNEQTRRLVQLVSRVVTQMDNKISISGHTDSRPYRAANGYTNWELSSDRANAARRLLIESGLGANRIALVQGRADTDPLLPTEPESEQNRRISIVLLRENAMPVEINEQNFGEGVPPQAPPPNEFGANDPDETPARRTEIADDRSPG
jgi:flagellar motor protein MotB